jgi:uncharacterized peroxidase-related enzyme
MLINVTPSDATDEVERYLDGQERSWGYLPNYAAAYISRPDVAKGWAVLNGAIRDGMDPRRYEIATLGAARALRSTYCTAAHSKFLRDDCGDEQAMIAIATGHGDQALDEADRAILTFAGQVARDAASISEADVDALREVGLTDNEIADVVFAAAARCFFATVADAFGAEPDHQLAEQFAPDVLDGLVVGRPIADAP